MQKQKKAIQCKMPKPMCRTKSYNICVEIDGKGQQQTDRKNKKRKKVLEKQENDLF